MKRMAAVLLCGAALTAAAVAQDTPPPPPPQGEMQGPPPGGPGGPGRGNPARQLEMMKTRLSLTDDQVAKIKVIQEEGRTKMQAVRNDSSLEGDARRDKSRALMQDQDAKIKSVLTDDQKKKYDEMQAQMRERRGPGGPGGSGGPGGDNPPPPPPPQSL